MRFILALFAMLVLACGSVTESVAPDVLDIWTSAQLHNSIYHLDAYMLIEGQGQWHFNIQISGFTWDMPQSPGDWDKDGEGTVWTTFYLDSITYPAGTNYIITGYHGNDSMTYEGVLP